MPKIADAKGIHPGAATGTAVYAGTVKVWPAAAPFSPLDIAGCQLWLDATTLALANSAPVEVWPDLSGAGRNVICDPATHAGSQPIFHTGVTAGKPAVNWPGDGQMRFLWTPTLRYDVFQFIAVGRWTGANPFPEYNGMVTGQTEIVMIGTLGGAAWYPAAATTYHYNGTLDTGRTIPIGVFGVCSQSLASGWPGIGTVLGCDRFVSTRGWIGEIAEVVAYSRVLTNAERGQVEGYLRGKWGTP